MERKFNTHNITPVCRFGPGGDFVSTWPGSAKQFIEESQNPISRLLFSLSKLITAMQEHRDQNASAEIEVSYEGSKEYAAQSIQANSKAAQDAADDSLSNGQILLFTDDSGTVERVEHKPKHRVRAHRRAAKKRPDLRIAGQGSLFEANAAGTKTA